MVNHEGYNKSWKQSSFKFKFSKNKALRILYTTHLWSSLISGLQKGFLAFFFFALFYAANDLQFFFSSSALKQMQ